MTATVTAYEPAVATQNKRRTLFLCLLGAVLLPALVAAVLPSAQAEDTVFVAADTNEATAASEAPTSATQPSTSDHHTEHVGSRHQHHGQAQGDHHHDGQAQGDHHHDGPQGRGQGAGSGARSHGQAGPTRGGTAARGVGCDRRRGVVPGVCPPARVGR